jgi:DNA-binding XRE family transcriptional regulator
MSDVNMNFSFKEGQIVSVRAEVLKQRQTAETPDGAKVDYYVIRILGSDNAVVVNTDQVKTYEQPNFRVRSLDVAQTASTIGNNIRRYRKAANVSQQQLAQALGIKQAAVSLWEHGRTTPRSNMIPAILEMLNISIEDLYGDDEQAPRYKKRSE